MGALRHTGLAVVALAGSLGFVLAGCAGRAHAGRRPGPEAPAAAMAIVQLEMPLPEALREDADEGFARSVPVIVRNSGNVPVAVTELWVEGVGEGRRKLLLPGPPESGTLRAFGFLPPGESVRHRLGVSYPRPGSGTLSLHARVRLLPRGTSGKVMEEMAIPKAGEERVLEARAQVSVAPRSFDLRAALARIDAARRATLKETAYSETLGGWIVVMDTQTLLLTPGETREIPGLSLAAVHLMDHYEGSVPVLDGEDRLREVPKGPLLRLLLEESLRGGHSIGTAEYAPGKEALLVQ